jgi:dTDP-4-amino-4,6-dideoxygalactose transaminase
MIIPFNIPFTTGKELEYIKEAIMSGNVSGNGFFTRRCQDLLKKDWGFNRVLLTSSCTDALEMCALLLDIKPGDEVIVPSYTFVSTALAFARQGAVIVFADSRKDNPCIDEELIEKLITEKTKVIVPVHYNGISCKMDKIMEIAQEYNLWVVEDAAHAFGSRYKGRMPGTIGHFGCFSFHETKVIHCGEGGMLSVNDESFINRAEIIWEKGTNRCDFHRGKVNKYEWIDTGSSFLMSDLSAAFLYAQLKEGPEILRRRKNQWTLYWRLLKQIESEGFIDLPVVPENTNSNYSGFYILTKSPAEQGRLLKKLNNAGIQALTHYLDLANSPYILQNQKDVTNKLNMNSLRYQNTLLRLPLYHKLSSSRISGIAKTIISFYRNEVSRH